MTFATSLLWLVSAILTQEATLRGSVIDAVTRRPVVGAVVQAGPQTMTTDAAGRFSTIVMIGPVVLTASAAGYVDASQQVEVSARGVDVELALVSRRGCT